jgi:small-conductance mechanosensitive channel/CRP-like cAMP-binding protein
VSSPRYLVLRQLAVPALLLAALCVLAYFDTEIVSHFGSHLPDRAVIWLGDLLGVALWVAVAIFITRLVRVIVWDTVVAHAIGAPVPHLLKDVGAFIIFAIAACGMVHYVFDKSLTGFLATGGVIGLVLGMALQSVILDAFTGIVLNIERPYSIGDWIGLQNGEKETVFGKVAEVNWRATRVLTDDGNLVLVPNRNVGTWTITNYSRPSPRRKVYARFCLEFSAAPARALRVLYNGALAAAHPEGPLADPPPVALIQEATLQGLVYSIEYWQSGHSALSGPASRLHEGVLRHLAAAGLPLAHPKLDQFNVPPKARALDATAAEDRAALFERVEFFKALPADDRTAIAAGAVHRAFRAGETVLQRGDPGSSMFVLLEGIFEVRVDLRGDGSSVKVGQLHAGDIFGEMSLLTGEPRSATVAAVTPASAWEVTREEIEPLLKRDPHLANVLAHLVAERRLRTDRAREAMDSAGASNAAAQLEGEILIKLKRFFSNVFSGSRSPTGKP